MDSNNQTWAKNTLQVRKGKHYTNSITLFKLGKHIADYRISPLSTHLPIHIHPVSSLETTCCRPYSLFALSPVDHRNLVIQISFPATHHFIPGSNCRGKSWKSGRHPGQGCMQPKCRRYSSLFPFLQNQFASFTLNSGVLYLLWPPRPFPVDLADHLQCFPPNSFQPQPLACNAWESTNHICQRCRPILQIRELHIFTLTPFLHIQSYLKLCSKLPIVASPIP